MNISITDINEFLICPHRYQLKQQNPVALGQYISIEEKYTAELKRVVYFFFYQIQNDDVIKFEQIKKRWSDLWLGPCSKKDILLMDEDPIKRWKHKKTYDGLKILYNIYSNYTDPRTISDYDIVAIDTPYTVRISDDIMVVGSFPVIRCTKTDGIEILDFKMTNSRLSVKHDLELSILSIALKKQLNQNGCVTVYYYDTNKTQTIRRTDKVQELAINNAINIVKAMESKIDYKVCSTECDRCPYIKQCREE